MYKKNIFTVLILGFSFITVYCVNTNSNKNNNHSATNASLSLTSEPPISITQFLFLKKGMNLIAVRNYLDNNSIRYSKLVNVESNTIDYIMYENMKYITVYNYNLDIISLDEFKIYFIQDRLYEFEYFKHINEFDSNNENKGANMVFDYYSQHKNVIITMYNGLKEKYGLPKIKSKSDALVSYYGNDDCNFFRGDWDNYDDRENLIRSNEVSISLGNSFCIWQHGISNNTHEYSYNQFIRVDFNDTFIENEKKRYDAKKLELKNKQNHSDKEENKQFIDKL